MILNRKERKIMYLNYFSLSSDYIHILLTGSVKIDNCESFNNMIKDAKKKLEPDLYNFLHKLDEVGWKLWCLNDDIRIIETEIKNLSEPYLIELERFKSNKAELLKVIDSLRDELIERFYKKYIVEMHK